MLYQPTLLYKKTQIENDILFYAWAGSGNNANTVVLRNMLRGPRPHLMIDPGHVTNEVGERCLNNLAKAMEQDKIELKDVGLIINTHSHMDHTEACLSIQEKGKESSTNPNIPVLITVSAKEEEYRRTFGQRQYGLFGIKRSEFEPYFYLNEGELKIGKGGKKVLRIIDTPGHSPGSICIYLPEYLTLITGDLIFFGATGRTDLPGGSMLQLKKSIEKVSELDIEFMLPGHSTQYGSYIKGKQNIKRNFQAIRTMI